MPDNGNSRRKSEFTCKERKVQLAMLLEKEIRFSTVCAGMFVFAFMLGGGALLTTLGIIYSKPDLVIVGGIFGLGGIVFLVMFIVGLCRPYLKNRQIHAEYNKELVEIQECRNPVPSSYAWYSGSTVTMGHVDRW